MVNAHLSLLSSGFRIKQTGCFLIGCRSPPFRLNFENSDGTEEIGVKRDPSAVFIKTKDGYAELTYEEYCRYCKGNPSYQNRRFLFLHGMLMEVSEQDYMAFYRDKRRQKYLWEQAAGRKDVSIDVLLAEGFYGEDSLKDLTQDVAGQVEQSLMLDKLRKHLPLLEAEEQELIYALFFQGLSERQWAAKTSIPQRTINDRKRRVLAKLKKFLENKK